MLSLVILCCTSVPAFASDINTTSKQSGEQKFLSNRDTIPSIPADYIESIVAHRSAPQVYSDQRVRTSDEMLEKLSMLYLAVERAESEIEQQKNNAVSQAIVEMKKDIAEIEEQILADGAIQLTEDQIKTIFADVNMGNSSAKSGEYEPPDTDNTRYYLYGPYTISTDEGDCTYYYVTATALSTNSNMWASYFIPMNEDRVSSYVDAVVDVYVGKVAGEVVGALAWWTNFLPWELLLDPPATHYSTTATYTVSTQCVTNVKFVWCYSPTMYEYFLGVVLNSTSVREVHDNQYVYNGVPYGDIEEKNYTLTCDNYYRVASVTREYWESYEYIHLEYIKLKLFLIV